MIEIFLSTDGKHTVRVEATKGAVNEAYDQASKIYNQILKDHGAGTKVQAAKEKNGNGNHEKVPSCPECGSDMVKRQGAFGDFWGCSTYPDCKGLIKIK